MSNKANKNKNKSNQLDISKINTNKQVNLNTNITANKTNYNNKQTIISSHYSKDKLSMSMESNNTNSIVSSFDHSGMMMNDNDYLNDEDLKGIPSHILELQHIQPTLNIMTCGDVSHGKSTLLAALSGEKTGKYSDEIRNNMTKRLGYTSCKIWKCLLCTKPQCYFTSHSNTKNNKNIICINCGNKDAIILIRHLSFVDVPGHAQLMQTMVSAECVSDAAIVVIDSSKECPGPQMKQHCDAINLLGLLKSNQIIIAQNKIDLINIEKACFNYEQIRSYLSTFGNNKLSYNTPIIPISAQSSLNIDALCHSIINHLPKYSKKLNKCSNSKDLYMHIIRSFDVNRPKDLLNECDINNICGGVIGGAVLNGHIEIGQLIEIRPGYLRKKKLQKYKDKIKNKLQSQYTVHPIITRVISMEYSKIKTEIGNPGGNVGIQTNIDPSLTKNDGICGHIVIDANNQNPPPIFNKFIMSYCFLGKHNNKNKKYKDFKVFEQIRVNIGSFKMKAEIVKKNIGDDNNNNKCVMVVTEAPICAYIGDKVGICRKIGGGKEWLFVGGGIIRKTKNIQIISDLNKSSSINQKQEEKNNDEDVIISDPEPTITEEPNDDNDDNNDDNDANDDNNDEEKKQVLSKKQKQILTLKRLLKYAFNNFKNGKYFNFQQELKQINDMIKQYKWDNSTYKMPKFYVKYMLMICEEIQNLNIFNEENKKEKRALKYLKRKTGKQFMHFNQIQLFSNKPEFWNDEESDLDDDNDDNNNNNKTNEERKHAKNEQNKKDDNNTKASLSSKVPGLSTFDSDLLSKMRNHSYWMKK